MKNHELEFIYSKFLLSDGVSIDSRSVNLDDLFFGLKGPNFNGSQYAEKALANGAIYAVVDDPKFDTHERTILVEDSLKALQDLAVFHRDRFRGKVFAITGSNGKTTTKELIREVLSKKYVVHATRGNLNNHIGVPISLLQLTPQTEIAIIEMGANHIGEIEQLCALAKPSHGLITNIGKAHTEGFGGIEGVLRGKSELFEYLRRTLGETFINKGDERLMTMSKRLPDSTFYPSEDLVIDESSEFLKVKIGEQIISTNLSGDYNFSNVAAAIIVGRHFGVNDDQIVQAIENYKPENNRSQVIKKNSNTIILDAYNANPDSMLASLQNLSKYQGNKVAILGDMNELSNSDEEHRLLGKVIAEMNLNNVLLVGKKIIPALESLPNAQHFASVHELSTFNFEGIKNAVILLKASRSIRLEEILTKL